MEKIYKRKISSDEEKNEYIFILKNKLSYFPTVGEDFTLLNGNIKHTVNVKSYDCNCVGPDKPHKHYYINFKGLKKSSVVEIEKLNNGEYKLMIN